MSAYRVKDNTVRSYVNPADGNTYWYVIGGDDSFQYAILVRGDVGTTRQQNKMILPSRVSDDEGNTYTVCCIEDGAVEDWGICAMPNYNGTGAFAMGRWDSVTTCNVTELTIPSTIDYIGANAFYKLCSLNKITIEEYEEVEGRAEDYYACTETEFKHGQTIGACAFCMSWAPYNSNCEIYLPSTIVSFGSSVFSDNKEYSTSLLKFHFPETIKATAMIADWMCADGNQIIGIDSEGNQAKVNTTGELMVNSIRIPEGIETMSRTFKGISTGNLLILPSTLKSVTSLCVGGNNSLNLYYGLGGVLMTNYSDNIPTFDEQTLSTLTCTLYAYNDAKDAFAENEIWAAQIEANKLQFVDRPKSPDPEPKRFYCIDPLIFLK